MVFPFILETGWLGRESLPRKFWRRHSSCDVEHNSFFYFEGSHLDRATPSPIITNMLYNWGGGFLLYFLLFFSFLVETLFSKFFFGFFFCLTQCFTLAKANLQLAICVIRLASCSQKGWSMSCSAGAGAVSYNDKNGRSEPKRTCVLARVLPVWQLLSSSPIYTATSCLVRVFLFLFVCSEIGSLRVPVTVLEPSTQTKSQKSTWLCLPGCWD